MSPGAEIDWRNWELQAGKCNRLWYNDISLDLCTLLWEYKHLEAEEWTILNTTLPRQKLNIMRYFGILWSAGTMIICFLIRQAWTKWRCEIWDSCKDRLSRGRVVKGTGSLTTEVSDCRRFIMKSGNLPTSGSKYLRFQHYLWQNRKPDSTWLLQGCFWKIKWLFLQSLLIRILLNLKTKIWATWRLKNLILIIRCQKNFLWKKCK